MFGMRVIDIVLCVFSLVFVAVVVPCAIVTWAQGDPFQWSNYLCIAVSASAGYLIVELVCAMIFRPYRQSWWHPFSLFTFGYWKEGLLARHRKDAKESLSRQLDRSICNSERVASQLSDLIPDIVEKTAFENKLINGNGVLIRSLRQGIVEELSARIQSESTDIACCAREELDSLLKRCLDGRESLSAFSSSLTAAIVSRMDWKKLEKRILHKLQGLNIESIVDEECRDLRDASHDFVVRKLLPDLRTGLTKISSEEIAEQIVCKLGLARRMSDLVMDYDARGFHQAVMQMAGAEFGFFRLIGFLIGGAAGLISFVR